MEREKIEEYCGYALSKQVPCIAREAVFETDYGLLILGAEDSAKVAELVKSLLLVRAGTYFDERLAAEKE